MKILRKVKNVDKGLEKITKLGIAGSFFLIAVAIFYYFVIYIPQRDKQKLDQQTNQAKDIETKYQECVNDAYARYQDRWDRKCEALSEEKDCLLNRVYSDKYDEQLKYNKETCLELYGK